MKYGLLFLLVLACLTPFCADSVDITLGINAAISSSPYKAKRMCHQVLPTFSYDNDVWYIENAEAGYYAINDDTNELKLKVYYDDQSYDSDDGHDAVMRSLNDRRRTTMGGASFKYTTPMGAFNIELVADMLNHSKGVTANFSYLSMLRYHSFTIVPEIGADWANAQQNRYYYGISSEEARRVEIDTSRPGSGFTPYLSLTLDYQFTRNWETYAAVRIERLSYSISNSPMVERGENYIFNMGVKYNF